MVPERSVANGDHVGQERRGEPDDPRNGEGRGRPNQAGQRNGLEQAGQEQEPGCAPPGFHDTLDTLDGTVADAHRVDLSQVAVLIPALNEEATLPTLLPRLPGSLGAVVVVDNGSTDRTAELSRAAGAHVVAEPERGYGAACLAGLAFLAEHAPETEVVVFLDADHARGPDQIGALVKPVTDGEADMVLGVRVGASEGHSTVPPHARWGNRLVLGLAGLLFGETYSDMAPFRAVTTDALARLEMDDRNWGWTLQMQVRAARLGLRVAEVPLPHVLRTAGESKISGSLIGSVKAGGKMFFTLARERLRP